MSHVSKIQDRPVGWRFRLGLFLLLPGTWLLQLVARGFPHAVENGYSRTIYPVLRDVVATLTGWFGWSLFELLLLLLAAWVAWGTVRGLTAVLHGSRSPRNLAAHALSAALAAVGVLYAWGIFGWGLNYQRLPLAVSAGLDAGNASTEELTRLAVSLATEASTLRAMVDEDDGGVMTLAEGKRQALEYSGRAFEHLGPRHDVLQGSAVSRAKVVRLPVLAWLNLGGVFSVFTSEPNVNAHQPAAGMLAAACHELAHQAGWAREDEASFVGYAACRLHPDTRYQYATTQAALLDVLAVLRRVDAGSAEALVAGLHPGILRDWEASRRFWARYRGPIGRVAERTNDAYLKSQGQRAGVRSYGMLVDLLVADQRKRDALRDD